jgi:hypothetical protein
VMRRVTGRSAWVELRRRPRRREGSVHASIIDMTLRLPVDEVLFDELRTDFLPKAAQHSGFCGFQYVLAEHGRAIGILWYEQPEDLDAITRLVGSWFQDHIAPRLAGPQTAVRGRVVVNMTPPDTVTT